MEGEAARSVRDRRLGDAHPAVMDPDASDEMTDHLVDFFDQIASVYDSWAGGQHGRVAARLVELAAPKPGEHVLDVATGTGLVAHLVAAKVAPGSVIGIDLSDRMLSIARSKQGKNTQFVGMAAERLVFRPTRAQDFYIELRLGEYMHALRGDVSGRVTAYPVAALRTK